MKDKLAQFQKSKVGEFLRKVLNDRAPNLAVLLAWGTLNTMLPLILGILSIAGFILRDQQRLDSLSSTMFAVLPTQAAETLQGILTTTRQNAGAAGIVSLVLLLLTGTNFFANMQMVFNLAYHVADRNLIMQRVVALIMLVIVTALLLISTTAYGLGNALGSLPIALPVGPVLGRLIGWAISLVSAVLMFLLLYKVLPNKPQSWKQALPGAGAATVLFFIILQVFPLYLAVFGKGFQAYAAFGVFLLLMFWLYLLGLILVIGAELNAFLEDPGRSAALAETTMRAEKGDVAMRQKGGEVEALATGSAPEAGQDSAAGGPKGSATPKQKPAKGGAAAQPAVGIGGRLIGLVGLVAAAVLLRGQKPTPEPSASRHS